MTPNRVTVGLEKYAKKIPSDKVYSLKDLMQNATDECYDEFMFIHLKSRLKVVLFSILLGAFGVDRFYVEENGAGVGKIIFQVIVSLVACLAGAHVILAIIYIILLLILMIWRIADIFSTYKSVKEINYARLSSFLKANKKRD